MGEGLPQVVGVDISKDYLECPSSSKWLGVPRHQRCSRPPAAAHLAAALLKPETRTPKSAALDELTELVAARGGLVRDRSALPCSGGRPCSG